MQWLSCLIEEEQEMKKRGEKTYEGFEKPLYGKAYILLIL